MLILISKSSIFIFPLSVFKIPINKSISVDFPEPDFPSIKTLSFFLFLNLNFLKFYFFRQIGNLDYQLQYHY